MWCIVGAAVLDGMDGRIARRLKGQSRFGAELDSLSDVIAFGVSPAIILHLWALQEVARYGWIFALAYAVCAALRLAPVQRRDRRRGAAAQIGRFPDRGAGSRGRGPAALADLFVGRQRQAVGLAQAFLAGGAVGGADRVPG